MEYSLAIKIDPEYFVAYNNRGSSKFDDGDYMGAIEDFSEAVKINPDYAFAYNNRGAAKLKLEDYDAVIRDCSRAIKINSNILKLIMKLVKKFCYFL